MKASFNLIDEKWIPCVPVGGGSAVEVGIVDALTNASEYREIYDNSPLVTISLHRLLLAILYRALKPVESDWFDIWSDGCFPREALLKYLKDVAPCFYLFSDMNPFLQVPCNREENCTSPLSILFTERASNTNRTLFDHSINEVCSSEFPSVVARKLVAYQSCALGGGNNSSICIGQRIYPPSKRNYTHGVLQRGAAIMICGETLFETLMLNLVPYDAAEANLPDNAADMDRTAWEFEVLNGYDESRPCGYADRYTWQSRLIRIYEKNGVVGSPIVVTQGLVMESEKELPSHLRDPMFCYMVSNDKKEISPWNLKQNRASWRDLHALLAIWPKSNGGNRPPLSLYFFDYVADKLEQEFNSREVELNVFGTVSDRAKIWCWRHERMRVQSCLLHNNDLVERLSWLLNEAERIGRRLKDSTRELCRHYLSLGERVPQPKDVDNLSEKLNPHRDYWAKLEGHFYTLLRQLPLDKDAASETWYQTIIREAYAAFNKSAGQLGQSARAIRARALVYPIFDSR